MNANRWGGKRHRRSRRERIVDNRVRRLVRLEESQDARTVDRYWRLVGVIGEEAARATAVKLEGIEW
jgi:hypothetical protein